MHRGLCPRVSAFAGFRANPETPGVTYKMVKDYKVIMKIKKSRKIEGPFWAQAQKKGGGRPGLYTFSRLSGIREHTRLAREARVFADADKLFMVTFIRAFFAPFAAGPKRKWERYNRSREMPLAPSPRTPCREPRASCRSLFFLAQLHVRASRCRGRCARRCKAPRCKARARLRGDGGKLLSVDKGEHLRFGSAQDRCLYG